MAEITASSLFLGLLFGSIGLGLFMYGKKQRAVVPLLCGLVLLVVPYLISSACAYYKCVVTDGTDEPNSCKYLHAQVSNANSI